MKLFKQKEKISLPPKETPLTKKEIETINNIKKDSGIEEETFKVKEDLNEKPDSTLLKIWYNILLYGSFIILGAISIWVLRQQSVENKKLILFFMLSILINIIVLILFFYRGVGAEVIRRLKNKKFYQKGNYVNTLHVMKSGIIKERFMKIDSQTQSFKMNDQPYVMNPKCLHIYKDMKTYIHVDGYPAPIHIKQDQFVNELSCPEMDKVMYSASNFDLKAWIEKHKMLFIIIMGIIMIGVSVACFKIIGVEKLLKDGTYNADVILQTIKTVCMQNQTVSNVIQQVPII